MKTKFAALALALILALSAPLLTVAHRGIDWRTNGYRAAHDLRRLPISTRLHDLAARRARQISVNWGHDFWWGPKSGCTGGWGENIAYRNPPPDNPGRWFFRAWRDSLPHREVMLGRWSRMASAVYVAPNGGMYAVQLFGLRCG